MSRNVLLWKLWVSYFQRYTGSGPPITRHPLLCNLGLQCSEQLTSSFQAPSSLLSKPCPSPVQSPRRGILSKISSTLEEARGQRTSLLHRKACSIRKGKRSQPFRSRATKNKLIGLKLTFSFFCILPPNTPPHSNTHTHAHTHFPPRLFKLKEKHLLSESDTQEIRLINCA